MKGIIYYLFFFLFCGISNGVKHELFKTCDQNGFCHRNRALRNYVMNNGHQFSSPYVMDTDSLQITNNTLKGNIFKNVNTSKSVKLPFIIEILQHDSFRIRIDEDRSSAATFLSLKNLNGSRYNLASSYAVEEESSNEYLSSNKNSTTIKDSDALVFEYNNFKAKVHLNKFQIDIYFNNNLEVSLNHENLFNLEHLRSESDKDQLTPGESDYNAFHDDFSDSSNDKLPFGPESVGLDILLYGYNSTYGVPEHSDSFKLKSTVNSDPYRLFNVDIFEYETNSKLPMYGSIPFMMATKQNASLGLFWINAADTYVDIDYKSDETTLTHWFSESGIVDLIIIIKKDPVSVNQQFSAITGNVQLPQLFSLGYHQCRWNYNDVDDVLDVSLKFDEFEIPYDVIWLDIEYTENKKYFTWKKGLFEDHLLMNNKLAETGRNLVAIIDPHLKTDYEISQSVISKNIAIKNNDNSDTFKGHCWPGESVWIDTINPMAIKYWIDIFNNKESTMNFLTTGNEYNVHIWNDMNEPSVFSGPETTAPKDLIHYGDFEHRSVHNLYGLTFHEATFDALTLRTQENSLRPFVLTRSYFAGLQRTAAMWSGDNQSKWPYLKISIPMLLTSQVANMPFTGSDVGGFFGDPTTELLTRWYQAGIWYPFFRGHAHIDSKRREPYLVTESPYKEGIKKALKLRYSLLPVWYTAFHDANTQGLPVIYPMMYTHPFDSATWNIEDQFFIGGGSGLLVKPVTDENVDTVEIYIPSSSLKIERYYRFRSGVDDYDFEEFQSNESAGKYVELDASLTEIPMLIQGGHIFAKRDIYRRSSKLMRFDPFTLVVALDSDGTAEGKLYIDDGESYKYLSNGEYLSIKFQFLNGNLEGTVELGLQSLAKNGELDRILDKVVVNKILIAGLENSKDITNAEVAQNSEVWSSEVYKVGKNKTTLLVRNPKVNVKYDWNIHLS